MPKIAATDEVVPRLRAALLLLRVGQDSTLVNLNVALAGAEALIEIALERLDPPVHRQ